MLVARSGGLGDRSSSMQVVDILSGYRGKTSTSFYVPLRDIKLCFMFVIATVYIAVQSCFSALRARLVHRPFLTTDKGKPDRRVEVIVKCGEEMNKYLVSGETMIATRAARLTQSSSFRLVTLDDEGSTLPALVIRIRIKEGETTSKLIFTSPIRPGTLRLFRRFGMDRVPIKPTENINVLTDTVQVGGNLFISFSHNDTKIY